MARILQQFAPLLLTALDQGWSSYQFADSLQTLYGRLAYEQIRASGKEKIISAIEQVPDLWVPLATIEGRFNEFVDHFFDFDDEMKRQEEEQDVPTPSEPVRVQRK